MRTKRHIGWLVAMLSTWIGCGDSGHPPDDDIPPSRIQRGGFGAELDPWVVIGNARAESEGAHHGHWAACADGPGSGLRQRVDGLMANTEYILSAYVRADWGGRVRIGVRETGIADAYRSSNSTIYTQLALTFWTGETDHVEVYFEVETGTGCTDTWYMEAIPTDVGDAGFMDASPMDTDASTPSADAPGVTVTWSETSASFLNPERGFYRAINLATDRDLAWVRSSSHTLVWSYIRLDPYRETAIPASLLEDVQEGLDAVRDAGLKVILRCAYNIGPYPNPEPDASLSQILAHLQQLAPLLRANEDVIAVMQAGFIGAWGEWHSSSHALDMDPDARRDVLEAILEALPATRSAQLRVPMYKEAMFGAALTEAQAHSGSNAARTGHHNDCFLASDTDLGTYPSGERERWLGYLAQETRFVPMGGETCAVYPNRSTCSNAPSEMERLHFTYLNRDYHPDVLASWSEGGCLGEIETRLGYRFVLVDGNLPTAVRPGGSFRVHVRVRNEGYAAPINSRPVWFVLAGREGEYEVVIPGSDIRHWQAGETAELDFRMRLPANAPLGEYTLALWLPDGATRLQSRPDYAIQMANQGTWNASEGWNVLGSIQIDPAASGTTDPNSTTMHILEQ